MRVVLDTNILARSAYSSTGPAAELLERIRESDHVLIISSFILSELDRVLRYPRLARFHGLSDDEIARYVTDIEAASLVLESVEHIAETVVAHDPDDDPIVATAVAGQAEVICTLDRGCLFSLRNGENTSSQDQFFFRHPIRPTRPNGTTALDSLVWANSTSKIDTNA